MTTEYWVSTVDTDTVDPAYDVWSVTNKAYGKRDLAYCLDVLRDAGRSYKVRKYGHDNVLDAYVAPAHAGRWS